MNREDGIGGADGEAGRLNLQVSCRSMWRLLGGTRQGEEREAHLEEAPGEDLVHGMDHLPLVVVEEDSEAPLLLPLPLVDSSPPGEALLPPALEEAILKELLLVS